MDYVLCKNWQMTIWNIKNLNGGERDSDMIDHRSYRHILSSWEIKGFILCITGAIIHIFVRNSNLQAEENTLKPHLQNGILVQS